MNAYIHTHTHTCMHAYMHTCIHSYMHVGVYVYACEQVATRAHGPPSSSSGFLAFVYVVFILLVPLLSGLHLAFVASFPAIVRRYIYSND